MTSSGLVPPSSKKFLSLFEISCSSYRSIYRWLSRNWGKKKAEKSEGRGPQRGVIGDELTDGRKKPSSFFSPF
jgi:hypothetical protein